MIPIILILIFNVYSKSPFLYKEYEAKIVHRGKELWLKLAITPQEHAKGLSGVKNTQMKENEGLLFISNYVSYKKFWMIDTYFNLDIIFLNKDYKVVGIEKNMKAHPGEKNNEEIARTSSYLSKDVLEIKSNSDFSRNIKKGDKLKIIFLKNK